MNVDTVLIDDDDVDMEPVVILDEDDEKIISEKAVVVQNVTTVETIILDDESPISSEEKVKNNAAKIIKKPFLKISEKSFINNLKNNRLMDKIVRRCINMENATGMPRVVYKTLLPLYRDTSNTFKESGSFRTLLKNTYKLLMKDPDHKFLHVKTLCEELKSGGLRRKVPFVTLATNLKNNGSQWDHTELTSSSREMNQNNEENRQIHKVYKNNNNTRKRVGGKGTKKKNKKSKSCAVNATGKIKTRSVTHAKNAEKTDIINLDDSDTDSVDMSENDDGRQNDVFIVEETEPSDQRNDNENTVLQETLEAESKKGNQVVQDTLEADSNKEHKVVQETLEANSDNGNKVVHKAIQAASNKENKVVHETLQAGSNKENKVVHETLQAGSNKENKVVHETLQAGSNKENKVVHDTIQAASNKENKVVHETLQAGSNKENKVVHETLQAGSNKENKVENGKSSDKGTDYELLIPKTHVEILPIEYEASNDSPKDLEVITRLERQIENYKKLIDKLEEEEVTTESPFASPYYLCSKYKEYLVICYNQICEIKGNCKDIVKRREIRLIVAEGHPPGPAKRLEEFLNSTIDKTGTVEFPDFSDVVKCVVEANLSDNLAWNRQKVMEEAVVLFRECGQALRKRRQKREYRDLMSLVRDKEKIDDPAEKDPILLAKLEENKLIARLKEEDILERYVRMENNESPRIVVGIPQVSNAVEFESDQDSSGSDSESEQNIILPSLTSSAINNLPETGECSRSNISLSLLQTNNIIVTSTFRNNQFDTGQSSKTNDVIVNNLNVNPMLLNLLITPNITQNHLEGTATNTIQYAIGESSIMNDVISNNDSDMLLKNTRNFAPDTMRNVCETIDCSDKVVVGSNNATINEKIDMSSINNKKNIENTEIQADKEPCNVNDVQDYVSSTTDGIEQNCGSSISNEDVEGKTEDNVKREPLDIQNMLDELGDGFVCQVFDIEDPFLVIEISSDGFTDDDEL